MATITTEFGKLSSKGQRAVYLRVRDKKTEKRIATGVKVDESEISPRTKKIKNFEKAQTVEKLRMELMYKMTSIAPEINYSANMDAARIVSTLVMQEKTESLDFFTFAEDWISKNSLKSTKNYNCTLSALESYLGVRKLDFSQINYTLLKNFELYLSDRPRAKSMYLGYMRHLYREAMLEYNTDEVTVIKNDPFMRYKAPKQVLKKGVRALSVQDILKVYHYKGIDPKGRPQLARDCFILSFCLMGMNSADLYNATVLQKGVVKYNRTKTKDRRSDDAYIEVKVHPFIKQLMKKYAGNSHVFNFYQRYAGFEETRLTALTSVGFMAPKAVEYMKQRMGIPLKSIQPHKSLINKAAQLLLKLPRPNAPITERLKPRPMRRSNHYQIPCRALFCGGFADSGTSFNLWDMQSFNLWGFGFKVWVNPADSWF